MYVTYIERNSLIHIVAFATKLGAARFLPNSCTTSVQPVFFECWGALYTELSDRMRVDRRSCFGDEFFTSTNGVKIDDVRSSIEAHSRLESEERFHEPLRNSFRNVKRALAVHMLDNIILEICVEAMDDILDSEIFVSTALLLESLPSTKVFEDLRNPRPALQEQVKFSSLIRA